MINVAGARGEAVMMNAAGQAGWKLEDADNLAALPGGKEARDQLVNKGIHLPFHDSGHENWNQYVRQELRDIRIRLGSANALDYGERARKALELLQERLRERLKAEGEGISQDDPSPSQTPA